MFCVCCAASVDLWLLAKDASRFPFGHLLSEPSQYIFQGVTQDGVREEFYDETRRLCDLRLHKPYLQVREPHGNKDEKMFNQYLSEFPETTGSRSMLSICDIPLAVYSIY